MSRDAAAAFLATVAADAKLRVALDAHLESAADAVEALVEFADLQGHSFAPADLAAALAMETELGEADLDRVAGGGGFFYRGVDILHAYLEPADRDDLPRRCRIAPSVDGTDRGEVDEEL
jgi:predicted ribosomally synthesized peptide with nif11-like leader